MSERVILHSDMNCFYASVEMLHHPEFAGMPLAVGGNPEARHGIVLTANYIAKKKGVKTGMALWQAKQVCPEIIFVPPRMDLYLRFSQMAREIYSEYTDKIEPYGIDEAWLDVSDSRNLKGSGMTIAREISHRIKYELGVTVSIGISWNKIYAKLGSDYKKPDAITEFNRENYKDRIWQLPASDLLYVGRQTNKKLQKFGIRTIGQLAESDEKLLESHFGKIGNVLWAFANGWDEDPVCKEGYEAPVKSIGNSTTTPRDLENDLDVRAEPAKLVLGQAENFLAVEVNLAVGLFLQAQDRSADGGFAAAGLTDQTHRCAALDLEGRAVNRLDVADGHFEEAGLDGEVFFQILDDQQVLRIVFSAIETGREEIIMDVRFYFCHIKAPPHSQISDNRVPHRSQRTGSRRRHGYR